MCVDHIHTCVLKMDYGTFPVLSRTLKIDLEKDYLNIMHII